MRKHGRSVPCASGIRSPLLAAALVAAVGLGVPARGQIYYYGKFPVKPPGPNPKINNGAVDRGVIDFQLNPFGIAGAQTFVLDSDTGFNGVMTAPGNTWRSATVSDPGGFGFPRPNPLYKRVWGPLLSRQQAGIPGPTNFANGAGFGGGDIRVNGGWVTKLDVKDDPADNLGVSCGYLSWQATFMNGPVPWNNGFYWVIFHKGKLPARPVVGGVTSEVSAALHVTFVMAGGAVITPPPLVYAVRNNVGVPDVIADGTHTAVVYSTNGLAAPLRGPAAGGVLPAFSFKVALVNFVDANTNPAFPPIPAFGKFTMYCTLTFLADPGGEIESGDFTPDEINFVAPGGMDILSSVAASGYTTSFEAPAYNASATGTLLTGQQGYYLPAVAGSQDFNVFPHGAANNSLGIVEDPEGGVQMAAGRSLGGTSLARAQHPVDFSAGGIWKAQWDCLGMYNGVLPAADNLGSFSLQDSAVARYWQQVMQWGTNTGAADKYNINYSSFPANSPPGTTPTFVSPGAAWTNIPVAHWIRQSTTWDFTSGKILEASIQDLTAGGDPTVVDVSANNWYLRGAPGTSDPLPTDIRMFAGGAAGNITAWDNLVVTQVAPGVPTGGYCYANCDDSTIPPVLNANDFLCFLNKFANQDPYANCDESTVEPTLNANDFLCFLNAFAAGCS